MNTVNLALTPVVSILWLAGCALQPQDDPVDDGGLDQTPQAIAGAPSASEHALDGRAAVAAEVKALGGHAISPASLVSSWFSGSVAAGATQHWSWNNVSLTAAYKVGLVPTGASTTALCQFQVTRTWDVQQSTGEREFHFTIKNTSDITCGATILLAVQQRTGTWKTGGIDIGTSREYQWNNANPRTAAYVVGVSPSGATSSSPCEIEVTRSWYLQQPSGEREFHFVLKNIGAIACQGDIQLAQTTDADSSWASGDLEVGTESTFWHNNPLDRVYVPGLSPTGASGTSACRLEMAQSTYAQFITADGTTGHNFNFTVANIGSLACGATVLLNYLN